LIAKTKRSEQTIDARPTERPTVETGIDRRYNPREKVQESIDSRKKYDVFISYAREDEHTVAQPLADEFRARGFEVWLDRLVLEPTSKLEETILSGLQDCYCPVVIISKNFLQKPWPKKELDILLALEEIDDRSRIVTVRHEMSESELEAVSPFLAQRTKTPTTVGINAVCDAILQTATQYALDGVRHTQEADSAVPLARFFAPGAVQCPNAESTCSWKLPEEWNAMGLRDVGPEFTLTRKQKQWYVTCGACGALVGSVDREKAKWILTFVRMHIYAPERAPYLREE
jgi:hypothetical protein